MRPAVCERNKIIQKEYSKYYNLILRYHGSYNKHLLIPNSQFQSLS